MEIQVEIKKQNAKKERILDHLFFFYLLSSHKCKDGPSAHEPEILVDLYKVLKIHCQN